MPVGGESGGRFGERRPVTDSAAQPSEPTSTDQLSDSQPSMIWSVSWEGCPLQITLPSFTTAAAGMPLTPK